MISYKWFSLVTKLMCENHLANECIRERALFSLPKHLFVPENDAIQSNLENCV